MHIAMNKYLDFQCITTSRGLRGPFDIKRRAQRYVLSFAVNGGVSCPLHVLLGAVEYIESKQREIVPPQMSRHTVRVNAQCSLAFHAIPLGLVLWRSGCEVIRVELAYRQTQLRLAACCLLLQLH